MKIIFTIKLYFLQHIIFKTQVAKKKSNKKNINNVKKVKTNFRHV